MILSAIKSKGKSLLRRQPIRRLNLGSAPRYIYHRGNLTSSLPPFSTLKAFPKDKFSGPLCSSIPKRTLLSRAPQLQLHNSQKRLSTPKQNKSIPDPLNAFIDYPEHPLQNDHTHSPEANQPLKNIRVAVKDNFLVKGWRTTCGSKMLEPFISPYTATLCQRILDAGASLVGKTNLDEFAMGSTSLTSYFGPTLNPHGENFSTSDDPNQIYIAGGSSSGSAVAVATDLADMALGSDTGGSVRQPAAWCGVVGFKPSYGRLSRYGLVSFASSFDTPGLFTKTVKDAAFFYSHLHGHDPYDSTSLQVEKSPFNAEDFEKKDLKGLRIGIPQEYFIKELDPAILAMWKASIDTLHSLGATVESVSLPHTNIALSTYYTLITAEAYSNLARYDGVRFGLNWENRFEGSIDKFFSGTRSQGFGSEVQRRILLGSFILSRNAYNSFYRKGQQCRHLIKQDFDQVFKNQKYDALVFPTTPSPALSLKQAREAGPVELYAGDLMTVSANLAGVPAISIPCGKKNHLPLGMQVMTDFLDERTCFKVAWNLAESIHV